MRAPAKLTVVVLVYNGESVIANTLKNLATQSELDGVKILVVCNGCRDRSAVVAGRAAALFEGTGARYEVLDLAAIGRVGALNAARLQCEGGLVVLDQDAVLSPGALSAVSEAFGQGYCFVTLRLTLTRSPSFVVRAYYRFWTRLRYVQRSPATIGFYAVSPNGLSRLPAFPSVHSDDKFARMQFNPSERIRIEQEWYRVTPQNDLLALVRDRARYNQGNRELAQLLAADARPDAKRSVRDETPTSLSRWGDGLVFAAVLALSMVYEQLDGAE